MMIEDYDKKLKPEYNSSSMQDPKYKIFMDWCEENGMIFNGIQYPTFFEGGLRGVSATRDIKPYEGIIFVPNKLLLTVAKAKEDKILSKIIKSYPDLFIEEKANPDYNILILSLLREKMKGPNSFWHPFISLIPKIDTGIEWPQHIIDQIDDPVLKAMVLEAKQDVDEQWEEFSEVFCKYPNMFERVTKKDFVWATQFVVSRVFSWYLPTPMLVPLVDMINHDQEDQCSTEIMHKNLEMIDDEKERKNIKYQRIRKKYDLKAVMPDEKFGKKKKKSGLVYFVDQFSQMKMYKDHRLLSDEEELRNALLVAEEIVLENENIHVWHIPTLHEDYIEEDDDYEDVEEEEDRFSDMVEKLKIRLETKLKKPVIKKIPNLPRDFIEKEKEIMRESFYQRKEKLFSVKINKVQKASDYKEFLESVKESSDESSSYTDSSSEDEYVYNQEKFPWYRTDDKDFYLIVANNRNKFINKGKEVTLNYGNRSNYYLITWYGFSLWNNKSNSLKFRMIMDQKVVKSLRLPSNVIYRRISEKELEEKILDLGSGRKIKLNIVSKEFKSTLNSLDYELLQYLRALLWPEYQMSSGAKNSKFSLSIPTDVKFERFIFKHYIKIYNSILLNFKNDEIKDREEVAHDDLDYRIKMIKIAEIGCKQIATEQIRLGRLVLALLQNLRNDNDKIFKKLYMRRIPGLDKDGDQKLKSRFKIAEYLKTFFISKLVNIN